MKSNNSIQWTKLNALKFVIFCQLASTEVKSLQNFVEKPVLLCVGRLATFWLVEKFPSIERRSIAFVSKWNSHLATFLQQLKQIWLKELRLAALARIMERRRQAYVRHLAAGHQADQGQHRDLAIIIAAIVALLVRPFHICYFCNRESGQTGSWSRKTGEKIHQLQIAWKYFYRIGGEH